MALPDPEVPSPAPATHAVPAITPEQMQELALADERERALSGLRTLALWNGVGFLVCAAACLISALFDPWAVLYAGVLAAFAYVELRARKALLSYDTRAPRTLCRNQISFCAVVVAYALVQIYLSTRSANPLGDALREHPDLFSALSEVEQPELTELAGDVGSIYRTRMIVFYGLVALLTLLFQGGSAFYYARRGKLLDAFVTQTPAWVLEYRRLRANPRVR